MEMAEELVSHINDNDMIDLQSTPVVVEPSATHSSSSSSESDPSIGSFVSTGQPI